MNFKGGESSMGRDNRKANGSKGDDPQKFRYFNISESKNKMLRLPKIRPGKCKINPNGASYKEEYRDLKEDQP